MLQILFTFSRKNYPNEEVNRTEPSPSVIFPWYILSFLFWKHRTARCMNLFISDDRERKREGETGRKGDGGDDSGKEKGRSEERENERKGERQREVEIEKE